MDFWSFGPYWGNWLAGICAAITLYFFLRDKYRSKKKTEDLQAKLDRAIAAHEAQTKAAKEATKAASAHADEAKRHANAAESSLTLMQQQVAATNSLSSSFQMQTNVAEQHYRAYIDVWQDQVMQELKRQLQIAANVKYLTLRFEERLRDWKGRGHGLGDPWYNIVNSFMPGLTEQIMKFEHPYVDNVLAQHQMLSVHVDQKDYSKTIGALKDLHDYMNTVTSNAQQDVQKRLKAVRGIWSQGF